MATLTNMISALNTPVSVLSGTGTIGIGNENSGNRTINIGGLGNAAALSLICGSGGIFIGTNAATANITIGNNTGSSSINIASGTGVINIGNSIAKTITIGNATGATAIAINTGTGGTTFNSGIRTTPVSSNTATTAFGASLTAGTALQNLTGYDILVNIAVTVTAATTATLTLGVGSTSTPTTNTAVPSFTVASSTVYGLSAVVPNNYYVLVSSTGTPTIGSITVVATPL
jgi:hypothetical protein